MGNRNRLLRDDVQHFSLLENSVVKTEFSMSISCLILRSHHTTEILRLPDAFVIRQLPPWSENMKKRQIKSPKAYIRDSGLLHTLLGLESREQIERHPKVGASWEGFIVEHLVRHLEARKEEIFFWGTHAGAELDLLVVRGQKKIGFEIKRTTSPSVTPSMRNAISDLRLQKLYVLHAGKETFPLQKNITAVSVHAMINDIPVL